MQGVQLNTTENVYANHAFSAPVLDVIPARLFVFGIRQHGTAASICGVLLSAKTNMSGVLHSRPAPSETPLLLLLVYLFYHSTLPVCTVSLKFLSF